MASSGNTQQEELSIPKWNIKSDYVETCTCDFGCPCNFDGFPPTVFVELLYFFISNKVILAMCNSTDLRLYMLYRGQKQSMRDLELYNYSLQRIQIRIRGVPCEYLQVKLKGMVHLPCLLQHSNIFWIPNL